MYKLRFVEYDFWYNKIKSETPYIADDEIRDILNEYHEMMDVTIHYVPYASNNGFATKFIDNITNTRITLDELNTAAFDFYIKEVTRLSVNQQKSVNNPQEAYKTVKSPDEYINQIRNMLTKKPNKQNIKIAQ